MADPQTIVISVLVAVPAWVVGCYLGDRVARWLRRRRAERRWLREVQILPTTCRRCIACGHPLPGAGPTAQVSAGVGIWVRRVPDGPLCGPYCCGDCAAKESST